MKKLDTSACTVTTGFPPKQGTWDFLQAAYTEAISSTIISMIGAAYDPTVLYRLYGAVRTVTGSGSSTYVNFTAGAAFYNGEVLLVPAASASFAATLGIVTTQYTTNADPVTFTDGIARNVHNIRTIGITTIVGGWSDLTNFRNQVNTIPSFGAPENIAFDYNKVNYYTNAATGVVTLALTGTQPGTTVNLVFNAGSGGCIFSITGAGSANIMFKSGTDSFTIGIHEMDITYLGVLGSYPTYSVSCGL